MTDVDELVRTDSPVIAAEVVCVLLKCRDDRIRSVKVEINRMVEKQVAV